MPRHIPWYIRNPKDGTELVLVPGGWFWMGLGDDDPDADNSEKPRHLHYVEPFYIAITCITVSQFRRFVEETKYKGGKYTRTSDEWSGRWGYWKEDDPEYPVRYVNWYDANAYCKWAGLRLPTEAEWELCARGYEALRYPWGDDWEGGQKACWDKNRGPKGKSAPVFYHPKGVSPFGTFQQSGNLWEWSEDLYIKDVYKRYEKGDMDALKSGDSFYCVLRGGSWNGDYRELLRGAYRLNNSPEYRSLFSGFRPARTVKF